MMLQSAFKCMYMSGMLSAEDTELEQLLRATLILYFLSSRELTTCMRFALITHLLSSLYPFMAAPLKGSPFSQILASAHVHF